MDCGSGNACRFIFASEMKSIIAAAIGSACHLFAKCPLGERGGQMVVRKGDLNRSRATFKKGKPPCDAPVRKH